MAHFAQLNDDNIVTNVIRVNDEDILDENGNESEEVGIQFLQSQHPGTRWVQTSWNSRIRGSYAGIGDYYNEEYDLFSTPKPYDSWIFNPEMVRWDPPVDSPEPEEGKIIIWNEKTISWDVIVVLKPELLDETLKSQFDIVWIGTSWQQVPKPPIENSIETQ